jgi:hypothetical protein
MSLAVDHSPDNFASPPTVPATDSIAAETSPLAKRAKQADGGRFLKGAKRLS